MRSTPFMNILTDRTLTYSTVKGAMSQGILPFFEQNEATIPLFIYKIILKHQEKEINQVLKEEQVIVCSCPFYALVIGFSEGWDPGLIWGLSKTLTVNIPHGWLTAYSTIKALSQFPCALAEAKSPYFSVVWGIINQRPFISPTYSPGSLPPPPPPQGRR